jgi:hypothetical protein
LTNHRGFNAAAESFNSTIKVEYIHRHRFATRAEARLKIATWIVDFYNTRRLTARPAACRPPSSNGSSMLHAATRARSTCPHNGGLY